MTESRSGEPPKRSTSSEQKIRTLYGMGSATRPGDLSDHELRAEIELLADVIAAVGCWGRRLEDSEIDRILGVARCVSEGGDAVS